MKILGNILFIHILVIVIISCTTKLGNKISYNNDELYYTDSITEWEAKKLGNYLAQNFFFAGQGVTSQIDKKNDTYIFSYIVMEGAHRDKDYINICKDFAVELSENVFNKENLEIHLWDNQFEILRIIDVKELIKYRNVEPTSWRTVLSIKGNSDKDSPIFELTNKPTKIQYRYNTPSPLFGWFQLNLYKSNGEDTYNFGIVSQENIENITVLNEIPGDYFLKIIAAYGNWEIKILEGVYTE